MNPSQVNDGARALEGMLARALRDTIDGILITAGTGSAYTATSNRSFTASATMPNGTEFFLRFHAASGDTPTLNISTTDARQIRWPDGTTLSASDIIANSQGRVKYNSSLSVYVLMDAPVPGIARTDAAVTDNAIARFDGTGGKKVQNSVVTIADGGDITATSTDAGVSGPKLILYHNSATPAANDGVGYVHFDGEDSAGNTDTYAKVFGEIVDPTSTSEDGRLAVQTVIAGALSSRAYVGHGLYTPNATDGDKGADTINASAIYDDGVQLRPPILATADTSITGTNGAAWTSLPAGINRITVMFKNLSLDDTDDYLVQIGDSGGLVTTGYVSRSTTDLGTDATSTAGFIIKNGAAANVSMGVMTLTRMTGNTWMATHIAEHDGDEGISGVGHVTLSGALDRLSFVDTGGDAFDGGAGEINILYE